MMSIQTENKAITVSKEAVTALLGSLTLQNPCFMGMLLSAVQATKIQHSRPQKVANSMHEHRRQAPAVKLM